MREDVSGFFCPFYVLTAIGKKVLDNK